MSRASARRPRLVAALLLLTAFIAGIAVGFALHRVARPLMQVKTIRAADMSSVLEKLDLTSRQRAQADSIIRRRTPATEAMMREVADRLRVISDSLDDELRSILTPAQRARLDSLRRESKFVLKRTRRVGGTTRVDTVFARPDTGGR